MLAVGKADLLLLKVLEGKCSERLKMRQGTIAVFLGLFQVNFVVFCQLIKCLCRYWLSIDGDPLLYGMKMWAASNRGYRSDQTQQVQSMMDLPTALKLLKAFIRTLTQIVQRA